MTDSPTKSFGQIVSDAHDLYMAAHPPSDHGWRAPPWKDKSHDVHAAWEASAQAIIDHLSTVSPSTAPQEDLRAALTVARADLEFAAQHNAAILKGIAAVAGAPETSDVEHRGGSILFRWIDTQPEEARAAILKMARMALDGAVRTLLTEMSAQPAGQRNFVTINVERGAERYALTLQRENGFTPAILIGDLKDDVRRLTAEVSAVRTALSAVVTTGFVAVGLFSSAVKSGEKWSEQCEEVLKNWRRALDEARTRL